MYERKRSKPLGSHTTLRHIQPGGNSRNFIDMKNDTGRRAFMPGKLGCVDDTSWHTDTGVKSAKVKGP